MTSTSGLSRNAMRRRARDNKAADEHDADAEMDGVNAGEDPIQREKDLRGGLLQREIRAGHEALLDILGVLEALEDREGEPKRRRRGRGTRRSGA